MKDEDLDLPAIMTASEVAKYLRLSAKTGEQTIRRLAREKKIKGFLIGNRWRFHREQVVNLSRGGK